MFTNSNTDNNSDFSDTEENNMRNFTVNIKESNLFPIDNLFINLKVFSKIQKNDKLIINDSILQVDDRYLQSLRRWLSNDDRIRVVEHILKIYNDSFKYYNYADNNYILPSDISIPFVKERLFLTRRSASICKSPVIVSPTTFTKISSISSSIILTFTLFSAILLFSWYFSFRYSKSSCFYLYITF